MGVIRGAICAENTQKDILDKATELLEVIFEQNNLLPSDVDAVIFSATNDLNACYPAKGPREHFKMANVAFMCLSEMNVTNGLDHCLRVSVFTQTVTQSKCKHCFVGRAKVLRQDL